MQYRLPQPINSEKDLDIYENFLTANSPKTVIGYEAQAIKPNIFTDYLINKIDKKVRIDCFAGNFIQSKIGILINVGTDYLEIRSNNNSSTIIPLIYVKYVTIFDK